MAAPIENWQDVLIPFFNNLSELISACERQYHEETTLQDAQITIQRLAASISCLEVLHGTLHDILDQVIEPMNGNAADSQESDDEFDEEGEMQEQTELMTRTHAEVSLLEGLLNKMKCLLEDKVQTMLPPGRSVLSVPAVVNTGERHSENLLAHPGRPHYDIDMEQVTYLFQLGFRLSTISRMLMVHRTTLWRRLQQCGIRLERYSDTSDEELLERITDIYQHHPHCGVTMMLGHLRSKGIIVQQNRVRVTLRSIDPVNSELRWGLMAQRRVYSVPHPNSLWHIDGHHALIRWRIVTHGGIDGFSRVIVYLECSNNNRASTVASLFSNAVRLFSLPSRVRGDRGAENLAVAQIMEDLRGPIRGSFIAGKSVHNCRIERLWRDVYYGIIQTFYSLFYQMEAHGILDPDSELDLFCLHFVFIPRINRCLREFVEAYNNHSLRTVNSWTPLQIWMNGMIANANNHNLVDNEVDEMTFGIDPEAPLPDDVGDERLVEVPDTVLPDNVNVEDLEINVNPLSDSENYGVDIFISVKSHLT